MEREVRYCTTSDGVRIAYCVEGNGPPVLMTPLLLFESFLLEDLSPPYRDFSRRLAEQCQLIQYDPRGVGSSARGDFAVDLESMGLDIDAVVQAAGLRGVTLFSRANASPMAISFATRHPTIVDRLVLQAPFVKTSDLMSAGEVEGLAQMCRANWDMASRVLADFSSRVEFGDKAILNAEWYRRSVSGEHIARLWEANAEIDVSDELSRIDCPTLVLQPMNDTRWTAEVGQRIASAIKDASFVPLPGGLHHFALGDAEPVLNAVFEFVGAKGTRAVAPAGAFRTILFTDLVGHTEMMSRLGDEQGRDVLREHERITRDVLTAHGGTEVKTMGDGFMASFGSVTRAVECAIALQRALTPDPSPAAAGEGQSAFPLKIRVGLNAGEPIEEDGDLFGATVILASRIASKAEGGEILVADTVRGLCSGKGFVFSDRGEFVAKGFDEPVRVYAVNWGSKS